MVLEDRFFSLQSAVHGARGCGQKNFQLVWQCHQLLSGFLAKGHYLTQVREMLPEYPADVEFPQLLPEFAKR